MKDLTVRKTLLGNTGKWDESFDKHRVSTFRFPSSGNDGDFEREIEFPSADGLILYLIKRIENLEKRLSTLEVKKK